MKINNLQIIILVLSFLLVAPVLAQEGGEEVELSTIQFGEYSVEYNTSEKVSSDHVVYKTGEDIVLSVFDTDGNGKDDLWLRYGDNLILDLEASDTTGDGNPDTVNSLDAEGGATELMAPEFVPEKVVLPSNPNPKPAVKQKEVERPDMFVLGPPPTENEFSFPFKWVVAIFLLGGAVYLKLNYKKFTKKG